MHKNHSKLLLLTGLMAAVSLGSILVTTIPSHCPPTKSYVYPVKFVCGIATTTSTVNPGFQWAVSPGRYYTSINIQNGTAEKARLSKVITLAPREPDFAPASTTITMELPPRSATAADCPDIYLNMGVHASSTVYVEGFLNVVSRTSLYVTGVYTGQNLDIYGNPTQLSTMDVERIPAEVIVR